MRPRSAIGRLMIVGVAGLVGASAGPAAAYHYARQGWRDRHYNYPAVPNGYTQIVNRFGKPCSDAAKRNGMWWRAADTGQWYFINFHRKLGGATSSNLDNDVYGHIQNDHLAGYIRHGIWGYACRTISGSSKISTHAWGIAVDVSSAEEWYGKCWSTVNKYHDHIWRNHGWKWGLSFCDPMHFQYATGY